MMLYLRLFFEFFKTGLFAVGGGMATLPFMYDISDRTGWFTHAQLADMIAVSESTPGPIGVNMATYVGFTAGGVPGAIVRHRYTYSRAHSEGVPRECLCGFRVLRPAPLLHGDDRLGGRARREDNPV